MVAAARPAVMVYLTAMLDVALLFGITSGTKNYYVHWNTTNPLFQISNTDHIIDVNQGNSLFEYDQVTIICPVYNEWTKEEDTEKYIIYKVSKEEYETCRITDPNPRIIAVCDKPYKLMFFTITFRSFTPQPGGLEFRPGQDYFFISTSARGDMLRRIGGRCSTHHMKVVFKVCCNDTLHTAINRIDSPALPGAAGDNSVNAIVPSSDPTWSVERRRTTVAPADRQSSTYRPPMPTTRHSYKGVHDLYDLHVPSINVKNSNRRAGVFQKTKHFNSYAAKKEGLKSAAARTATPLVRSATTALGCGIAWLLLTRTLVR